LARHAQDVEADAIAVHAASWWKSQQLEALIEYCEPIAAAARGLAFYLYDISDITGFRIIVAFSGSRK
jgi:N-acetylneuraminate lyase